MNPIFTYSNKKNLEGYWYDSFASEFDSICNDHLKSGRAKSFAFIVYNLHSATHLTLEDQGAFVELDRISGSKLTVFYFDGAPSKESNNQAKLFHNFNSFLLDYTGIRMHRVPFILFFDFVEGEVSNFSTANIRDDEKFVLNDLASAIKEKLVDTKQPIKPSLKSLARESMEKLANEAPSILYKQFTGLILKGIIS
jgi:hypothetical protein